MYYSKGGFYTGLAGYVSLYSKAALEETDLNAGYDFSISENTLCTIELTHYIIKNTDLANASIKNNVEVAFRHTFGKTYKIKLYFDNDFGNGQSDFSFTFENSLVYAAENVFKEDSRMLIKPSFSFTAATLNLVRRNQQEAFSRSRFAVTNYDLSLLIEYETGRFIIAQEATYDIPPARKRARLAKPADTTPVFYFTASVKYVID